MVTANRSAASPELRRIADKIIGRMKIAPEGCQKPATGHAGKA